MFIILANTLESTELRSIGISEVQFGVHFKQQAELKKAFADIAWGIFEKCEVFKTYLRPLPETIDTKEKWQGMFTKLCITDSEDHFLELVGSISGITRPKDRLYELMSKFREATQLCWEAFVKSNAASFQPGSEKLKEFLKAPRKTEGIRWKQLVLEIADRVSKPSLTHL
jgi:hypothetical protein